MRVDGSYQSWQVANLEDLDAALTWRDDRGGGLFWLTPDDDRYPSLALRVGGCLADVTYFPKEGHPGFRCLGGDGLPKGGLTTLVYQGADPASGEVTPNEFIVSFETAHSVAVQFFVSGQRPDVVPWFEL